MTRPARVLWLVKGLGLGGTERLVTLCAPRFPERFAIEVAYVLPHKDAVVGELRDAAIPVYDLGRPGGSWMVRLAGLLRSGRHDLIHTHSPLPAVLARLAGPRGIPMVHTEHNVWQRYHPLTRVANAATIGRNRAVYAVSRAVAASVGPWGRGRADVHVLHHGIDLGSVRWGPEARATARARLEIDPEAPVVGHVANFTPKKDQVTLLDAFTRVHRARPDARLVMVGAGPLEEELRARAAAGEAAGAVLFTGRRDDVPALLPGFDLFVLTSRYEGLPISLVEAMAAGVACVTTPVGGATEVLTDGREGRVVAVGDPAGTAEVVLELLGDPDQRRRLARAGRSRAAAFSIDSAVERMAAAYDRILAPREVAA